MATGAPGTNGVWLYGEDDSEATFSALLNKAASTTDTQLGLDRARLTTLENKKIAAINIVPSSVDKTGGTATISSNGLVTFAGVSSISLNGVFNSTYKNYKIILNDPFGSVSTEIRFRYRVSSTDNSSTSYFGQGSVSNGTTLANYRQSSSTYSTILGVYTAAQSSACIEILNPYGTAPTTATLMSMGYSASQAEGINANLLFASSISFTGFTMYPVSGTFTGTLQVIGFNA